MKTKIIFIICLGVILNANFISAQSTDSFGLKECINYAMSNNLQILQNEQLFGNASLDVQRSKSSILPTLNANANGNNNFGRSIDPVTNQYINAQSQVFSSQLTTQWILYSGLSKMNDIRRAKWTETASKWSLQKLKDDIALSVANQYLQVWLLKERKGQLENQLQNTLNQEKKTRILVDAGSLTKVKMLEVYAQKASDEANLVDIDAQIVRAELALKQSMNFDLRQPLLLKHINISSQLVSYSEYDLNNTLDNRISQLPSVQSAQSSNMANRYNLKSIQGLQYPTLSLSGSIRSAYSSISRSFTFGNDGFEQIGILGFDTSQKVFGPRFKNNATAISFGEQLKNNFGQTVGLNLNFNIFNGLDTKYQIAQAKYNLYTSDVNVKTAEVQGRNDVITAYENLKLMQKKYNSSQQKLETQKALYTQTEVNYNLGALNYYDFNAARTSFDNASIELLNAQYELFFQTKVFEYYIGKQIID
ncbi:MAG: TolC family protein [Bacteroidota bacterium]|nr:TolC family protein [Bacteroidota bacterium]